MFCPLKLMGICVVQRYLQLISGEMMLIHPMQIIIDGTATTGVDFKQTRDVGQYLPNPWGFYDMHGNVYEWTADYYQASPAGNFVVDPTGPDNGSFRVTRGGSWNFDFSHARSAKRSSPSPIGQGIISVFDLLCINLAHHPRKTRQCLVQFNTGSYPGPFMFGHLIRTVQGGGIYITRWKWILFLKCSKGRGYDFKAFVDGSQNGYPTTGEVWKHYLGGIAHWVDLISYRLMEI